MSKFIIRGISIREDCESRIMKNLHPGYYQFTEYEYPDFYGSNISVQAIVGENGSGKSSLLELMFRMVNNLAAVLFRKTQCNAAARLCYVMGIRAELEYEINGERGLLKCDDDIISLKFGADIHVQYGVMGRIEVNEYIPLWNIEDKEIERIASRFFYTIVTNYSLQSYVSADFADERVMTYAPDVKHGKEYWVNTFGKCWIDSLFNKNDGYLCPITLNPYRRNGIVDMQQEAQFAMERVSSLLIEYARMNKEYLDGYKLKYIEYRLNYKKLTEYFDDEYDKESVNHKFERLLRLFQEACKAADHPYSVANSILKIFRCQQETKESTIYWICRFYIVVKILSIASKYPSYSKFKKLGSVTDAFKTNVDSKTAKRYKNLARAVYNDKSHIGLKVHQAYNMLSHLHNASDATYFLRPFKHYNYEKELRMGSVEHSVAQRAQVLPPPFYIPKIAFTWIDADKKERTVLFNKLSSGEKQFIYTTSSVMYHMLNLRSVTKGRPAYRQINIVLDEVEICFHPEYQRTFVSRFLRIIKSLGNMDRCGINIIMTTHSPFILSDIVQSNILYLEDGVPAVGKTKSNPFGANVNDILHQSFFLKKGFMGSKSQHIYSRLLRFLTECKDRDEYNMKYARQLIDMLGDPLLKGQLQILYDEFLRSKHLDMKCSYSHDNDDARKEILLRLKKKIEEMQ